MNNAWERNAQEVENTYGEYVNWKERFYHCPYCEEIICEEDWNDDELTHFICPICEDEDADLYD